MIRQVKQTSQTKIQITIAALLGIVIHLHGVTTLVTQIKGKPSQRKKGQKSRPTVKSFIQ